MLCTERVSCSPPMNTWMPTPAALSRTASSMSMAICSSDNSSRRIEGPPLARSTIGFWQSAGITRAQDAARAEQRVALRQQRHDREIDALEPRGRPLEIAVVDGEHHRAPRCRIEHAGEAVLHAPVELVRAFQEKARRGLRLVGLVALARFVGFRHVASLRRRLLLRRRRAHRSARAAAAIAAVFVIGFLAAGFLAALRPAARNCPWPCTS